MEPVFFVLAIMGCGDGNAACSEQRIESTHYSTVQQCRAALPAALARNTDISYPVIAGACRANGPQWVSTGQPKRG